MRVLHLYLGLSLGTATQGPGGGEAGVPTPTHTYSMAPPRLDLQRPPRGVVCACVCSCTGTVCECPHANDYATAQLRSGPSSQRWPLAPATFLCQFFPSGVISAMPIDSSARCIAKRWALGIWDAAIVEQLLHLRDLVLVILLVPKHIAKDCRKVNGLLVGEQLLCLVDIIALSASMQCRCSGARHSCQCPRSARAREPSP